MAFIASDWRIAGSTGVTVSIGIPNIKLQVGGAILNLPLTNLRTKEKVELWGAGGGTTFGIDLFSAPSSFSFSTQEMPSDGIGMIYKKVYNKTYKANDFSGNLLVMSSGFTTLANISLCTALWLDFPLENCITEGLGSCNILESISNSGLMLNPITVPLGIMEATHAIGLFYGTAASTDVLGVDANTFFYVMTT